jgi:hypothetical protein
MKLPVSWGAAVVAIVCCSSGCSSASSNPAADGGSGDTGTSFDGNMGADAEPDAGSDAPSDAASDADAGCPAGSVVPQYVTSAYTLTRACSPWHVTQPVLVGSSAGASLTIEPGVTVLFDPATYLYIGQDQSNTYQRATLWAKGTASAPIVFTSSAPSPTPGSWGAIYVGGDALMGSALSWATIEYAGAAFSPLSNVPTDTAAVIVDSAGYTQGMVSQPLFSLTNVTIKHSGGSGVLLFGNTGFGPGSGQVTVTDWAAGGYPVVIDGNRADTIPPTLTTGATGHDGAIGILCEEQNTACTGQDVIKNSVTWPALPIPYVIENYGYPNTGLCGLLIDGNGTTAATLTIAAPNTLEFKKPCGIYVDDNNASTGFLVAAGTAQNPIVMTSANATPAIGDWAGIRFEQGPAGQGASQLSYVTMSYAQAPAGGLDPTAAVWVDNYLGGSQGPVIQNSAFTSYSANCPMAGCCGIVASSTANNGAAYGTTTTGANGNTFTPGGTGMDVCPETD